MLSTLQPFHSFWIFPTFYCGNLRFWFPHSRIFSSYFPQCGKFKIVPNIMYIFYFLLWKFENHAFYIVQYFHCAFQIVENRKLYFQHSRVSMSCLPSISSTQKIFHKYVHDYPEYTCLNTVQITNHNMAHFFHILLRFQPVLAKIPTRARLRCSNNIPSLASVPFQD